MPKIVDRRDRSSALSSAALVVGAELSRQVELAAKADARFLLTLGLEPVDPPSDVSMHKSLDT